ncbi:MAG: hypothetical protein HDS97_00800 [Bacteroidales bacterium]|nr:hypothetical protein [Bacteroidales bacterium]
MKKYLFLLPLLSLGLTSCLGDDDDNSDKYADWKKQNDEYLVNLENEVKAGRSEYTRISANWAPQSSVFIKWHNDTTLTRKNLSPLSTSTVDIKYALEDIEGNELGDSYSSSLGDSIYRSRPNQNIVGMWIAMQNMHVGDSVTMVIPYLSGYGTSGVSAIKPYSNLVYHVKMKAVPKYEY